MAAALFLLIQSHCKRNALLLHIHFQYFHFYNVAHADCFKRMLDVAVRDAGNVYQSILMNADIDEYTKIDDISNGAL